MNTLLVPFFAALAVLAIIMTMTNGALRNGQGYEKDIMLFTKAGDARADDEIGNGQGGEAGDVVVDVHVQNNSNQDRSAEPAKSAGYCYDKDYGPVLMGVDVVAYQFLEPMASAVIGKPEYTAVLNGYTFYFATAAHRAVFQADPWRYTPRWGGFCSWGVGEEDWWTKESIAAEADINYWHMSTESAGEFGAGKSASGGGGGSGNRRLQFFRSQLPMSLYMKNESFWQVEGDKHWGDWFGGADGDGDGGGGNGDLREQQVFNTRCVCQIVNNGDSCIDGRRR